MVITAPIAPTGAPCAPLLESARNAPHPATEIPTERTKNGPTAGASTVVDGAAVASVPHPEHSISGASSGKFPMNWGQTGSCGSTQVCGVRGFFKPPR